MRRPARRRLDPARPVDLVGVPLFAGEPAILRAIRVTLSLQSDRDVCRLALVHLARHADVRTGRGAFALLDSFASRRPPARPSRRLA